MPRIQVDPDRLQELGSQLEHAAAEISERAAHLDRAMTSLDWQVRNRPGIEAEVSQARQQAEALMGAAQEMNRFLTRKAEAFRQAEQESTRSLSATGAPAPGMNTASAPAQEIVTRGDGVEITSGTRWKPVDASLTSSSAERGAMTPAERRERYDQVLDQFKVEANPRYRRDDNTYCNIFVSDATRAMGAEVPHWVMPDSGTPVPPGTQGAKGLNANATVEWLEDHGTVHGWRQVPAEQAQAQANDGRPAVAVMYKDKAIGHVAMVRPGEYTPDSGCAIANVGATNKAYSHVVDSFGTTNVKYWVHD